MRLFLAAVAVVTSFICGALLIARLLPLTGEWIKLALAFAWLLGSIFVAWLVVGNQTVANTGVREVRTAKGAPVGHLLLYYLAIALALVAIVTRLLLSGGAGLKPALGFAWLVLFFWRAWQVAGKQTATSAGGKAGGTTRSARVRGNILYLAIALVLAAIVIGVAIQDVDRGMHR